MNSVQRNFKSQIKQVEREQRKYWRREKYKDRYTGKKYFRYYDQHGTLLKTVERKNPIKSFFIWLASMIGVLILIIIALYILWKYHIFII